jgi:hypothetical protein
MSNAVGRPTDYNPAIAAEVCRRVEEGSNLERLSKLVDFPCKETLYKWLRLHPEFVDEYARARKLRAEARCDRIDTYGDMLLAGEITPDVCRTLVDIDKWQAGHENPKYSAKADIKLDNSRNFTINLLQFNDDGKDSPVIDNEMKVIK